MQRRRIEVRAVRPHQSVDLGIYADLLEQFTFVQRAVQLSLQNRPEIYGLLRLIAEPHTQGIRSKDPKRLDAIALNSGLRTLAPLMILSSNLFKSGKSCLVRLHLPIVNIRRLLPERCLSHDLLYCPGSIHHSLFLYFTCHRLRTARAALHQSEPQHRRAPLQLGTLYGKS